MLTTEYRDYKIEVTLTSLTLHPLKDEMEGFYDDAEIDVDSLEDALNIARQSVDANYRLFQWTQNNKTE